MISVFGARIGALNTGSASSPHSVPYSRTLAALSCIERGGEAEVVEAQPAAFRRERGQTGTRDVHQAVAEAGAGVVVLVLGRREAYSGEPRGRDVAQDRHRAEGRVVALDVDALAAGRGRPGTPG